MRPNRSWPPYLRVRLAMARLTRDRWMAPEDVTKTVNRLLTCATAPGFLGGRNVVPFECQGVGMIRGRPPAYHFEPHYPVVLDAVRRVLKNPKLCPEIEILKTVERL